MRVGARRRLGWRCPCLRRLGFVRLRFGRRSRGRGRRRFGRFALGSRGAYLGLAVREEVLPGLAVQLIVRLRGLVLRGACLQIRGFGARRDCRGEDEAGGEKASYSVQYGGSTDPHMEVLLDARVLLVFTADMIPAAFGQQGSRQFALAEEPPIDAQRSPFSVTEPRRLREGDDEKNAASVGTLAALVRLDRSYKAYFTVNGTIASKPKVTCERLVPPAKGVVSFKVVSQRSSGRRITLAT